MKAFEQHFPVILFINFYSVLEFPGSVPEAKSRSFKVSLTKKNV